MLSQPFVWTADPDKIIAAVKRGHQALNFYPLAPVGNGGCGRGAERGQRNGCDGNDANQYGHELVLWWSLEARRFLQRIGGEFELNISDHMYPFHQI